jgi:hypothetical protein
MKPSRVAAVLESIIATRWPVFVWGPPGCGKSAVVQSVAKSRDIPVIDVRASLLDPTDLRGIPMIQDGRAVWCPPSFLPKPDSKPGILFFDELNAAPPLVQASLYQLTLDRRIGEYFLPEGWSIVAAGNRSEDKSIVFRMPSALSNRFIHVDFEVDYDDWRTWAYSAGVHPTVIGFLGLRRELLHDMRSTDRAFPTPRSWEMASAAIKQFNGVKECMDVLVGTVGEGPAIELRKFSERAMTLEQIQAVLADPSGAKLPSELGDLYALVAYLISTISNTWTQDACGVLLGRLPVELAVLLARDTLRVSPGLRKHERFAAFIKEHAKSINPRA